MHLIKRPSNINFMPSCTDHNVYLPEVEVIHEVIYHDPAKALGTDDNAAHQSFSNHLESIHIPNDATQDRLLG